MYQKYSEFLPTAAVKSAVNSHNVHRPASCPQPHVFSNIILYKLSQGTWELNWCRNMILNPFKAFEEPTHSIEINVTSLERGSFHR